jgi:hypothetical protein
LSTTVTTPWPSAIVACLAFWRLTEKVSAGALARSPTTGIGIALLVSPLAKVRVPAPAR